MMASKEDTLELPQLSHLTGEEAEGPSGLETSPGRETHPPPSTTLGKLLVTGRVPSQATGYCLPHWTPPTLRTPHPAVQRLHLCSLARRSFRESLIGHLQGSLRATGLWGWKWRGEIPLPAPPSGPWPHKPQAAPPPRSQLAGTVPDPKQSPLLVTPPTVGVQVASSCDRQYPGSVISPGVPFQRRRD